MHRKRDDHQPKREVFLVPGCYVSEINIIQPNKKPMHEFRIHWPEHVTNYGAPAKIGRFSSKKSVSSGETGVVVENDSDEEENLQKIAEEVAKTAKQQKNRQDKPEVVTTSSGGTSWLTKGATFASVAAGGVVVGVLSAGIGLPVYLGVVGAAAEGERRRR